jgi:hypothetical protein
MATWWSSTRRTWRGTDHPPEIQQRRQPATASPRSRQLAAVGPGGALADVAEHGLRYELAEVRRFTQEWERAASLRLREGDADVLAEYDKHGRLRDAGTAEQAEAAASRAWPADTLAGRESLLMVGSNAAAARGAAGRARVPRHGRAHRGRAGTRGLAGRRRGVGDLVQARRNGWDLRGNTAPRSTARPTA